MERLIERLDDDDLVVRLHAAITLGSFREKAVAAVPVLLQMLCHDNVADRKMACYALGEIGAVEAVQALHEAIADPHDGVCRAARSALAKLGPAAGQRRAL